MIIGSFQRRRRGERTDGRNQELLYLIVRWPLLVRGVYPLRCSVPYTHRDNQYMILLFILAEFGFYVLIRQIVNAKEWLSACRPPPTLTCPSPDLNFRVGRGKKGRLRLRLRGTKTYQVSLVPGRQIFT